ncbi:alpha/beta hydrolase [Ruegeria marisrubri]|uniref:Alpha/beta hydrolase n=1 Tax=Ruegeria marisrubri TaxID=1685379 RepID=A0A0X3U4C6_9RHOB|nr:alpha/beta fold hydrolase [Ruegeria marisrubri]KUJ82719.1 alpha/beta hydrolase [Ruegeria marisrubri]
MTGLIEHQTHGLTWVERPGNGPTLVLLHGIGSNATSFKPLLAHLPVSARVVAWNAPGYCGSVPLPQDWPVAQDYAAALGQLVDNLGIQTFALLGHSLGALVGAAYAANHADRVSRLWLASPALGHGVPQGGQLSIAAKTRIDDLSRLGAEGFAEARASNLLHAPEDYPEVLALVRKAMARVTLPGYAQAARMLASGRLLDDAERLAVPTDVIVGAMDCVTPPEGARRVYEILHTTARGQFTELPFAGHAIYQQSPRRFAEAMHAVATSVA